MRSLQRRGSIQHLAGKSQAPMGVVASAAFGRIQRQVTTHGIAAQRLAEQDRKTQLWLAGCVYPQEPDV